jgi:farnesyl-diphosphate farnesyltransferase
MEGAGAGAGSGMSEALVEAPSGKNAATENFPVGSWLIAPTLRPHIHAFYRFARAADDIADDSVLAPAEKLRRLDRMAAVLQGAAGDDAPSAAVMRNSLAETGLAPDHCLDLLTAFRRDVTKLRYRDWDDLMDYCRYSASPVGRQVLDLHGEARDTWPPSDALCSALQVLNHLQDCGEDYRLIDRVYVPDEDLAAEGIDVTALGADTAGPALRRVLDRLLDRTDVLIETARALPERVRDRRLRCETAIIVALAERLSARLRRQDPLARRVKLDRWSVGGAALTGLGRAFRPRAAA